MRTFFIGLAMVIAAVSDALAFSPLPQPDFYVSMSGSDVTGDSLSASTAWATLQHADSYIRENYTAAGLQPVVHLAAGNYSQSLQAIGPFVGAHPATGTAIIFEGDCTDIANVKIFAAPETAFLAAGGAAIAVKCLTISTDAAHEMFYATGGGSIEIASDAIGTADAHMVADRGGTITITGDYTIAGSANYHLLANFGGAIEEESGITITLAPGLNFAAQFVFAVHGGVAIAAGVSFVGSATGSKCYASLGGIIDTATGNPNGVFPGATLCGANDGGQLN